MEIQPDAIKETRFARQVVQPQWLNFKNEPIVDPTVYVNEKALQEADMIRKTIQKSVQEDSYAVTGEEVNPNLPMFTPQPLPAVEPAHAVKKVPYEGNIPPALPPWYLQMQRLWQNWSQGLAKGLRT